MSATEATGETATRYGGEDVATWAERHLDASLGTVKDDEVSLWTDVSCSLPARFRDDGWKIAGVGPCNGQAYLILRRDDR